MSRHNAARPVLPFSLPLEGRLLAHRRLLVELLRNLSPARREEMMAWIDDRALYREPSSDREPGGAFAPGDDVEVELARADEFQVLRRMVQNPNR